jgi:hypothetical protein
MRIRLLTILLFSNIISYSQSKCQASAVIKMNGIIYFEKEQDIYTMYFIETTCADLMYFLNTKDTATRIFVRERWRNLSWASWKN